jgi:hypothetical protein
MVKEGELERATQLAALKLQKQGGILIILIVMTDAGTRGTATSVRAQRALRDFRYLSCLQKKSMSLGSWRLPHLSSTGEACRKHSNARPIPRQSEMQRGG